MKLNVLQRFTLLSVAATAVIVVGLGLLVPTLLTRWLLDHEVQLTADALRTVADIDLSPDAFARAVREGDTTAFETVWRHFEPVPDILRVKVYGTDGRIVWSDEPLLIG